METAIRGGLIDEIEFERIDKAMKAVLKSSLPVLDAAYSFVIVAVISRDQRSMKAVWAQHSPEIQPAAEGRRYIDDRALIPRSENRGLIWSAVEELTTQQSLPDGMTKIQGEQGETYFVADGENETIQRIIIQLTETVTKSVFLAPIASKHGSKHGIVGMLAIDSVLANAFKDSDPGSKLRIQFLCAFSDQLAAIVELLNGTYYDRLAGDVGVLTRAHYDEQFEKLRETNKLGFLAHLDLNGFKRVNDESADHEMGDAVLKEFAIFAKTQIDESSLREQAWFYRFGGDEFGLLIAKRPSPEVFDFITLFLEKLYSQTFCCDKLWFPPSSSIGLLPLDSDAKSGESIRMADYAMYLSKQKFKIEGKIMPVIYDEQVIQRFKQLETRIRILKDQLQTHLKDLSPSA